MLQLALMVLLMCISLGLKAQNNPKKAENWQTFQGALLEKSWTKTTESYCAGGSNYWVLLLDDDTNLVLLFDKNITAAMLNALKGKKVSMVAQKQTKKITNDDPTAQRPVEFSPDGKKTTNNSYTCTIYRVKKIN